MPLHHCRRSADSVDHSGGGNGSFNARVDLNVTGHQGTLFKNITVTTDKGTKSVMMRIDFLPPVVIKMTMNKKPPASRPERRPAGGLQERLRHLPQPKTSRAVMGRSFSKMPAPSVTRPKTVRPSSPTWANSPCRPNEDFWRTWITYGKPGSVMPAFAKSQGGRWTICRSPRWRSFSIRSTPPRPTPRPSDLRKNSARYPVNHDD